MMRHALVATSLAVVAWAFLAAGKPATAATYGVTMDTSGFSPSAWQLDVNLTAGNGAGDASSVTLDNFSCSGCPSGAQTLTDSLFSQDLYIDFTAGGSMTFDLNIAPDLTDLAIAPDSFQLSILDLSGNPVATTDPYDAVLFSSLDSSDPTINAFGSADGANPSFAAPVVVDETVSAATPEPASASLLAAAGLLLLVAAALPGRRGRRPYCSDIVTPARLK